MHPKNMTHLRQIAFQYSSKRSLTNGRGYKSWVVDMGVGVGVGVGVGEELIMIINMNIINISYI